MQVGGGSERRVDICAPQLEVNESLVKANLRCSMVRRGRRAR